MSIVKKSVATGIVPEDFKRTIVKPLFLKINSLEVGKLSTGQYTMYSIKEFGKMFIYLIFRFLKQQSLIVFITIRI